MTPESFREWLSRTGTSLRAAAERSGVDKSKLSRWMSGKAKLVRPELRALESVMGPHEPRASVAPVDGQADDPISVALSASARMMAVLVEVAEDCEASPQVRVAAAARVLAYSPGRPGPLERAQADGPSAADEAKLVRNLERMAASVELASQIAIPEPPAPVSAPPSEPEADDDGEPPT